MPRKGCAGGSGAAVRNLRFCSATAGRQEAFPSTTSKLIPCSADATAAARTRKQAAGGGVAQQSGLDWLGMPNACRSQQMILTAGLVVNRKHIRHAAHCSPALADCQRRMKLPLLPRAPHAFASSRVHSWLGPTCTESVVSRPKPSARWHS